jgi:hypothetical protein
LRKRSGRYVLDLSKTGIAGQCQHLCRREEADEGRTVCSRSRNRSLNPGPHLGVYQLDRKQERHGERGARSERRDLAQRRRDRVLSQIHADTGGGHDRRSPGVEARRCQPLPPPVACLEVDWHEPQERRDAEAEVDEALALPRLRPRLIDLEYEQTGSNLRPTLGKGVETRSENDVLPDATGSLFRDEIFDEAGAARMEARKGRVNGLMSGRPRHPSSGAASFKPTSSSSTCGGESSSTCSARHKATRTAVSSGAASCLSCMTFSLSFRLLSV